jgi:hypothetical protein
MTAIASKARQLSATYSTTRIVIEKMLADFARTC